MDKTEASPGRDAPPQQLPELPEDVLVNILGRIPVEARLANCARVCSAWAAAAFKAPSALEVHLKGPFHCQELQNWLAQRGDHVTLLVLCGPEESRLQLQLPCARLTSLQWLFVESMDVDMLHQQAGTGSGISSSSNAPPNSSLLPALRELHLESCSLSSDGLKQLSRLSSRLTDLHLERLTCSNSASTQQLLPQALCELLTQIGPRLARLHLTGFRQENPSSTKVMIGAAALSPLSAMQQLQQATFSSDIFKTDCLQLLPTSLTYLAFQHGHQYGLGGHSRLALTRAAWPQLQQHTCLQELRLRIVKVQPSILPLLAGSLRRLRLERVWEAGVPDDDVGDENGLLRALGSLTQLQELETDNQHFGENSNPQHMSALTASSQLCKLSVYEDFDGDVGPITLPAGAMQHMFPAGRQLPHLRELQLHGNITMQEAHEINIHPNITHQDVASMVHALPALDRLLLVNVLEDGQSLAQLTAVQPGLTGLTVGGSCIGDEDVRLLARLTTLQDVAICNTLVTAMGLLYLTTLRHCVQLQVWDAPELEACVCNVPGSLYDTKSDISIGDGSDSDASFGCNKDSLLLWAPVKDVADGVLPVWRELQDMCKRDPKCQQALRAARRKAQGTTAKANEHEKK